MGVSKILPLALGCLLLTGAATAALSQAPSKDHDAHHPAEGQAAPAAPAGTTTPPVATQGGMAGMGMMTPEMMQMMRQMRGPGGMPGMMGGMQGRGMPEGGMDRGTMGRTPMMGGMVMCPMMGMMASDRGGMGMPGAMGFHGLLFGAPPGKPEEMTQERVRALLAQHLAALGNPRLKVGEIGASAEGNITAEIVTVDGSLVQRLAFNRYPGLVRRVD